MKTIFSCACIDTSSPKGLSSIPQVHLNYSNQT